MASGVYRREELEAVKAAGGKLRIQVVGLATIAEDVTPELALAKTLFFTPAKQSRRRSLIALGDQPGIAFPTRMQE